MSSSLGKAFTQAQDGENNAVEFDLAYPLTGKLVDAVGELRQMHGPEIFLLPMSATSAGGGIFQAAHKPAGTVVGLRFDAPADPRISCTEQPRLDQIELDQIVIDRERQQVCAGAAITLNQLNQALAQELGHCFRVPGADLTSYLYAAVGATFMTGGMGPQRRYFSDSVSEIALFDGSDLRSINGAALSGYAGTYGWSGIVSALRCHFYRFPQNEVAFALPVRHTGDEIARLLARMSPYTRLRLEPAGVEAAATNAHDLILGLEHVSTRSMLPLLRDGGDNAITARARDLQHKCDLANADGLIFVNGCSNRSIDEFLLAMTDEKQTDDFSIAGISLENAEVFSDAEEMRAVREAIPYAARMQSLGGRLNYKNHSDANIRIVADDIEDSVRRLWEINRDYVAEVENHFAANEDVDGEILVYGHLNPYGLDPHNRVTLSSDDEAAFERSREFLVDARADYYRALAALCRDGNAEFIGGEKTADSEIAIFAALGGPQNAPAELYRRFQQQQAAINAAAPMFRWRALPPYV